MSQARALIRAWLALLLALGVAGTASAAPAADYWFGEDADGRPTVRLHVYWSQSCPHCREALPFVRELPQRLPWLLLDVREVTRDPAAAEDYIQAARTLGQEARSVPAFVFCGRLEVGFHSAGTTGAALVEALTDCHRQRLAGATMAPSAPSASADSPATTHLPGLGMLDPGDWSLPLLTLALAGLDAFNPCAFFVLLFLLSLLVHARSRRRMLLIGGVFVAISGVLYFAFMAAWLNLFLLAGELRLVTAVAGALALVIGVLNAKDYFRWKQGPSLSIPEAAKPGLYRRMRAVISAGSLGPTLVATLLLALVANSYELLCTAGFPMVYTRALTLHGLSPAGYYGYLLLYNLIYVLPLAVIVLLFTWGLGQRRLGEREGRLLKLVSGYMMLALGGVLLLAPDLLSQAAASLGLLLLALLAAWLTRRLYPR